jgi:hypothetical protein
VKPFNIGGLYKVTLTAGGTSAVQYVSVKE